MTDPPPVGAAPAGEGAIASSGVGGLTVRLDVLLWLGLIAAAAALRLARLDALPLTFDESGRALEALRVSQGNVPEGWSGDLAAVLTSYLFRIFGESAFLARAVPAVAGVAVVGVVWLGGRALGGLGALTAGVLLALSPLGLLISRSGLAFSLGALLAVGMAVALLSYLREPRATTVFVLALTLGLAPSTDAVATTAAIAVVAFLLMEPVLTKESQVVRAWAVFRRNPSHWLSVALVLGGALQLGLTRFGTSVQGIELAGLSQWWEMFDLPRDSREPEYQLAILLGYAWPVLLFGVAAGAVFVCRVVRRGRGALAAPQLFLLVWTALAALVVALAGQREAGQLLTLVLPLALLAGLLADEVLPSVDWTVLRRWWPAVAVALAMLAYAALITTQWSDPDAGISRAERVYLVLAVGGAAALLAACYAFIDRRAVAVTLVVVGAVAFAFLLHTDLAITTDEEAVEYAADIGATGRVDPFRDTVAELSASRAGPVLIDPFLEAPLAWELRDLAVIFAGPAEDAGAVVVPAGRAVDGFARLGEAWRIGEGWYPSDLKVLPLWRWLVYREPYGTLDIMDVEILVPVP